MQCEIHPEFNTFLLFEPIWVFISSNRLKKYSPEKVWILFYGYPWAVISFVNPKY
jgi:hypothetical protein